MNNNDVVNSYFNWLYDIVCENRFSEEVSYKKLLTQLHNTEFRYTLLMDDNRAEDGLGLRDRFADEYDIPNIEDYLDGPCSVLEMMIALAVRCEESTMDDPKYGDRTGQWFWLMIGNLGLGPMKDARYDRAHVRSVLKRFLDRKYDPDGKGGLFYIENCNVDLREIEIWHQMWWCLEKFY